MRRTHGDGLREFNNSTKDILLSQPSSIRAYTNSAPVRFQGKSPSGIFYNQAVHSTLEKQTLHTAVKDSLFIDTRKFKSPGDQIEAKRDLERQNRFAGNACGSTPNAWERNASEGYQRQGKPVYDNRKVGNAHQLSMTDRMLDQAYEREKQRKQKEQEFFKNEYQKIPARNTAENFYNSKKEAVARGHPQVIAQEQLSSERSKSVWNNAANPQITKQESKLSKEDQRRKQQQLVQEELKRQIEEKKALKSKERERERQEEEKERLRIEREQKEIRNRIEMEKALEGKANQETQDNQENNAEASNNPPAENKDIENTKEESKKEVESNEFDKEAQPIKTNKIDDDVEEVVNIKEENIEQAGSSNPDKPSDFYAAWDKKDLENAFKGIDFSSEQNKEESKQLANMNANDTIVEEDEGKFDENGETIKIHPTIDKEADTINVINPIRNLTKRKTEDKSVKEEPENTVISSREDVTMQSKENKISVIEHKKLMEEQKIDTNNNEYVNPDERKIQPMETPQEHYKTSSDRSEHFTSDKPKRRLLQSESRIKSERYSNEDINPMRGSLDNNKKLAFNSAKKTLIKLQPKKETNRRFSKKNIVKVDSKTASKTDLRKTTLKFDPNVIKEEINLRQTAVNFNQIYNEVMANPASRKNGVPLPVKKFGEGVPNKKSKEEVFDPYASIKISPMTTMKKGQLAYMSKPIAVLEPEKNIKWMDLRTARMNRAKSNPNSNIFQSIETLERDIALVSKASKSPAINLIRARKGWLRRIKK